MAENNTKYLLVFLFLLILANIFVWQFVFSLDGKMKVVFFDIGEGDSIFVETPQGLQILIDGGPSEAILNKLPKVMPFWDRTIDLVVLSHPEYDHLTGLNAVLGRYKVENILWNGIERDTQVAKDWQMALQEEKAKVFTAQAGEKIKAGVIKGVVLAPLENLAGQVFNKDSNETAIVLQLIFGANKFLFTGDITSKVEQKMIDYYGSASSTKSILASDVLKVAHHGSKTSTSQNFISQVNPQIAVISLGRNNKYGHPSAEVLNTLQGFGIKVMRTDEKGDIWMKSDGETINF